MSALTGIASTITWGTPTTITGDADVATNGTGLYAWTGGTTATVNNLSFPAGNSGSVWGSVSLSGFGTDNQTAFGSGSGAPWSTLSTAYKTMLSGGAYGGASAGTVTLNGLIAGHSYAVQIWANDNRGGGEATRTENASSSGGNTVTLAYEANQASGGGGVGQFTVGTFVASGTSQSFTLTPSAGGSVQLNAINVHDIGTYVFTPTVLTPTRVNLAKYQPVLTDSVNSSQPAPVDGLGTGSFITDGTANNDSYWQSSPTGAHWAQVVFPFPVTVGSAQLALGRDTVPPPTVFWLQYLTNSTWVTVPGTTLVSNTNKEVNLAFTTPITASSFRFYDSLDGNVIIREMALYAPGSYPFGTDFTLDLAQKQPVFATANSNGNYPLLAVDGRISPSSAWQTTLVGSNSLLINLQFTNKLGSAHLYSGATGVPHLSNFVLQYWNGGAWQNIPGGSVTGNGNGALVIPFTTPVTTTKVQLVFTNTGVSAVQELCVFSANSNGGYTLGTGVTTNAPITAKYDTFSDSYYCLSNAVTGQAVVESNGVPVLGIASVTNFLSQYQVLLNYDNGTYRLRNRKTGLCLSGAQLTTNAGALLMDEPYSALPDQEWYLQPADGINYYLINQFSGLVLDTQVGGTALVQNVMTNTPTQLWQFPRMTIFPKKGSGGPSLDGIQNSSWCYTWWVVTGTPVPTNNVFYPMNDSAWYLGSNLSGNLQNFQRSWRINGQSQILMGYNEPDQTTQGNLDPTNGAIYWHNFNNMDMPLAAPAPASAGDAWLPIFFGYVTNWGLRVDYLPAHLYPGNNSSASSGIWINSLQSEYNTWGIPMWTTEFGCVDWAGNQSWTEENNYNALAEFMWRAESLPWLRKYAIFSFGGALAPNPWTATTPAPTSNCFDTNNVLTPLGELYGAWDGDATVETNKEYYLHNSGTSKHLASALASLLPDAKSILVRDNSVQWTLVTAGSANLYYLVSDLDGRRLSYSGSSLSLVAPGTTGTAAQWSLASYQYGWYYLQHPASGKELSLAYNNATFTATYSLVASTTTGTAVQWRFIVPPAPIPWTGGSNAFWRTYGNWNNGTVPSVGQSAGLNSLSTAPPTQGQPVTFNKLSTANLATILNTNAFVSTITVTAPAGPVSIAGVNLLTVGSGIDLSSASQDLAITAPVRLGGSQPATINFIVTNTHTLNLTGNVSDFGNAALNVAGGGTVLLGGTASYAGNTTVGGGTLNVTGSCNPGQPGGTNIFAVNGGVLTFDSGSATNNFNGDGFGYAPEISASGNAGTLTLQSGTLNVNTMTNAGTGNYAGLLLGCNSPTANGTLTVNGGSLNVPGRILMAANAAGAKGTLAITGGRVTLGTPGSTGSYTAVNGQGLLWFGGSTSTVNLYGGTLTLWSLYDPSSGSSATVTLSGGTLQALYNNSTFTAVTAGTLSLKVSTNGATIDPAGYAITIPNPLTHDSGLSGPDGGLSVSDSLGGGTLTLSAINTYTGPTTVAAGTLALTGSGSLASTMITVAGGATFNVASKSTLFALGNGSTLANSSAGAVLNGNNDCSAGTLALISNGTNASFLQTNGTMTLSAVTLVNVNNLGVVLAAGIHPLIAAAAAGNPGKVTGALPSVQVTGNGSIGPATLQTNSLGGVDLVVASVIASNPPTLNLIYNAGALTLTWPGDHLGWIAQSNAVAMASSNFWFDILDSQSVTNLVLPVNPGNSNVFYRLRYPF